MTKKERNKILMKVLMNLNENISPIDNILEACDRKLGKLYFVANWLGSIRNKEELNDYLITWNEYKTIICLAMVVDEKDLGI